MSSETTIKERGSRLASHQAMIKARINQNGFGWG
jgi:hypothetical protein